MDWLPDSPAEWTLVLSAAVLIVTTVGVWVTVRGNRQQKRLAMDQGQVASDLLALQRGRIEEERLEAARPEFDLEVDPASGHDTNPTLHITCTAGIHLYDLHAEILMPDQEWPAVIALISDEATMVDASPTGEVYKRYHLGTMSKGQTRSYSVQPDPGIGHREGGDQAWIRLIATSAQGAAWESTHAFRMLGYL